MIKMVVSDMDGTLLNSDLKVSKENLEAIKYLRDRDIIFCVATGRPDQLMKEYVAELDMHDPMIMYNGSVIGHPFLEERVFEQALSKEDVELIITYCEERDIIYMAYTKDKLISKPNYRVDFFEERNLTLKLEQRSVFEDVKDIEEIKKLSVQKILVIDKNELRFEKTKKAFNTDKFSITTSQKGFLDINPLGVNKGNALKILAKYHGIDIADVVAFGDQENDINMLQTAGKGIAMGNAKDIVKGYADEVTKTNNENGFAYWIYENIK